MLMRAQMIPVGRPHIRGLVMGILGVILADVELTMRLSGIEGVKQLQEGVRQNLEEDTFMKGT